MLSLDSFEGISYDTIKFDLTAKLISFNESFQTRVTHENGFFQSHKTDVDKNFATWLGVDSPEVVAYVRPSCFETAKAMLNGVEVNGKKTLGLLDISKMKINPEYREQNIKQQAGFSAEVIGTAKENIRAKLEGSELTTTRADDLPEFFPKNDQYVDKVRRNANGDIVERIQTKFVGKNAAENLNKLASPKCDKYFDDGMVDKVEIPSNFYDDIKNNFLPEKLGKLENQLERMKADGKVEAAQKIKGKIERYKKIDNMIEKSTVSSDEARYARLHPKRYTAKLFSKEVLSGSHEIGVKSGLTAASITAAVSTVDNVRRVINGEITAQEAFVDVSKDAGTALTIGYGTGFVSSGVASSMSQSSHTLIRSLGSAGVPAAVIAVGIDSYDSVIDYAQGKISGEKLAIDLGESATGVLGSMASAALAGAALGSVVPGAGTVAGVAVGLVGGMVGYAVATEAYATAIEVATGGIDVLADKAEAVANVAVDTYSAVSTAIVDGVQVVGGAANDIASAVANKYTVVSSAVVESADLLKDKALEMGQSVIDSVANAAPEALDDVRNAMNNFAASLGVPIHL
jgi:hypothetical protein